MRASTKASAWISLRPPGFGAAAERALQLPQRLPPLALRLRHDQVGEALDRGEVELAVLEGAAGEFAGLGGAQALELPSASSVAAMTARPPCSCSSAMSSPVSLCGPGNQSASAWSMASCVCGSRMRASAAWRGAGSLPMSAASAAPARGPEMRTTAIAAGGRPEERAKMVGGVELISGLKPIASCQ